MLDPQAADDAREKVAADAKSKLEAQGRDQARGQLGHAQDGLRDRQARPEADYRFYRFTGRKDLLDDLDHSLQITDGVLRFRIFTVDEDSPNDHPARHRADHAPRRGRSRSWTCVDAIATIAARAARATRTPSRCRDGRRARRRDGCRADARARRAGA